MHLFSGTREHRRGRTGQPPDADALPPSGRAAAAHGDESAVPATGIRPDLMQLDDAQVARVQRLLRDRHWRCSGCGGNQASVGNALYLGFLFASEDLDAYMVGVTCTGPDCPGPRDGIRLHGREFAPEGLVGGDAARGAGAAARP